MAIEIVSFPMKIAWWFSSSLCKRLPEGKLPWNHSIQPNPAHPKAIAGTNPSSADSLGPFRFRQAGHLKQPRELVPQRLEEGVKRKMGKMAT